LVTRDRLTGALFDVDGTLVDTAYLHTVAWWEALQEAGHDVPMASVHRSIGMGSDNILDALLGAQRDHDADERIVAGHLDHYSGYWDRLRPLPGAQELLRTCAGRGLRVVLASSADEPELAALRRALDADDVISVATSGSDAERSKPAPDILSVALERSGLRAEEVLLIGDSVWDVFAAARIEVPCIGVTCGGTSAAELGEAGAMAVYRDPAQLCEHFDESALGAGAPLAAQRFQEAGTPVVAASPLGARSPS
jgi:HAD superfamily hydrolase (TIGR01509 family)